MMLPRGGNRGRGRGRGNSGAASSGSQHSPAPSTPNPSTPFSSRAVSLFGATPSNTSTSPGLLANESGPRGQVVGILGALNDDTDLKITLDGYIWPVHSHLMRARSPFFEAICSGQWEESKTRCVELHDDNPRIFARFLQFIYCDDYEGNMLGPFNSDVRRHLTLKKLLSTKKVPTDPKVSLQTLDETCNMRIVHFELYELADKYGCQDLLNLARNNIAVGLGAQEIDNLRAMICHRNLSSWIGVIDRDQKLKEIFAGKLADNYKALKASIATELGTGEKVDRAVNSSISLREWLRWMEEDNVFCMMVVDAMRKKFHSVMVTTTSLSSRYDD